MSSLDDEETSEINILTCESEDESTTNTEKELLGKCDTELNVFLTFSTLFKLIMTIVVNCVFINPSVVTFSKRQNEERLLIEYFNPTFSTAT
jgi:hypothetical protein